MSTDNIWDDSTWSDPVYFDMLGIDQDVSRQRNVHTTGNLHHSDCRSYSLTMTTECISALPARITVTASPRGPT